MSEPLRPWKETDDEGRAAEVVRLVAGITPRPVDVGKGWDNVIERVARPNAANGSGRVLWFAAAAAAVLLAWVSLQGPLTSPRNTSAQVTPVAVRAPDLPGRGGAASEELRSPPGREEPQMSVEGAAPPTKAAEAPAPAVAKKAVAPKVAVVSPEETPPPAPLPEPALPGRGGATSGELRSPPVLDVVDAPKDVVVASGAIWSAPGELSLKLERGRALVKPRAEQYTVTTPEVTLVSTQARYAADVTEAGTVVRVFEGELEVFAPTGKVVLSAGEERTFRAGPTPSALDVVPPEVSSPACARYSLEQRVACLSKEARGEGLKAQAALYEAAYLQVRAGRAPAAELTLRESLRRFPRGVLHPEVRLSLIKSLTAQRRLAEAGEVGREFLTECPDDPRVSDVEAFLRTLDWLESR